MRLGVVRGTGPDEQRSGAVLCPQRRSQQKAPDERAGCDSVPALAWTTLGAHRTSFRAKCPSTFPVPGSPSSDGGAPSSGPGAALARLFGTIVRSYLRRKVEKVSYRSCCPGQRRPNKLFRYLIRICTTTSLLARCPAMSHRKSALFLPLPHSSSWRAEGKRMLQKPKLWKLSPPRQCLSPLS